MTNLRVGFDARSLGGYRTGVGTYLANLLAELVGIDDKLSIVLVSNKALPSFPWLGNERVAAVTRGAFGRNNLAWTNLSLRSGIARDQIDLFHSPGYTRPLRLGLPSIVTLHDVCYAAAPQYYSHPLGPSRRLWYKASATGADAILTVSDFSRREIIRVYGIPEEKVRRIYPGVDHRLFHPVQEPEAALKLRRSYDLPDDFVLFVGDVQPRRNLIGIVQALDKLKMSSPQLKDLELVVVGPPSDPPSNIKRDYVRFLGYVLEQEMPVFYSAARALVYPSFYEGFGFPVLEAMACGCPVIVSSGTACEEAAGSAGVKVDPANVRSISDAIAGLLLNPDLTHQLVVAGLERASQFRWRKTAEETRSVYSEVLATD
jgi:glycosyltransferase involved in cell wall biosynthesis